MPYKTSRKRYKLSYSRRWRAARTLQRAFRKRKGRKIAQRYNRTRNVNYSRLGKRTSNKKSLKKRVSALEVTAKHHHDKVSNTSEVIGWNGTALNVARNSYSGLLAVQGPKSDNTFEPESKLSEDECRNNDEIYCNSVRIRGKLRGVTVVDGILPDGLTTMTEASTQLMKRLCSTRVWIHILQDRRPFKMDAIGNAEVNPLPSGTTGHTAVEEAYQNSPPTFLSSQLQFFGPEVALRSYETGNRFKIISSQCIPTTFNNPEKFFDISVKIDRKLKYVAARPAAPGGASPANPPTVPYNYNLLVFFTCVVPVLALPWAAVIQPPILLLKSSRMYFKDS